MKNIMSQKLYDNNNLDSRYEMIVSSLKYYTSLSFDKMKSMIPSTFKKKLKNVLYR